MGLSDAPAYLLDYFRLDRARDVVRWATESELRDEPPRKRKVIPYGREAGGRYVVGHGRRVSVARRDILTCDIRAAILDGYQWPWDAAKPYVVPGKEDTLPLGSAQRVLNTWRLVGAELQWRIERWPTAMAGDPAIGAGIAGRTDRMITLDGVGYMRSDILSVLKHGRFPWEPEWD